jgi:hypothetical protein
MKNRLRTQFDDNEIETVLEEPAAKEYPDNFFTQFLSKGIINAETVTSALPFILFLALLGMIYIANRNFAEKNIRDIDKISKEVKDLSYDYKTTKAELAFKSTLTEVAKQADTLGIKESLTPPQKITVGEDELDDHQD